MLKNFLIAFLPTQPAVDLTFAVGHHVYQKSLYLKKLAVEILKAVAKCWAFFKDIYFCWYVIIPIMASMPAMDERLAFTIWLLLFLPVLVVITFVTLDSIFDLRGSNDASKSAEQSASRLLVEPAAGGTAFDHCTPVAPALVPQMATPRVPASRRPSRYCKPGRRWA